MAMTQEQLRLKLERENTLLRLELAVLQGQNATSRRITQLRQENQRLNEKIGELQSLFNHRDYGRDL